MKVTTWSFIVIIRYFLVKLDILEESQKKRSNPTHGIDLNGLFESICVRPSKLANAKRSVIIYNIIRYKCSFLQ